MVRKKASMRTIIFFVKELKWLVRIESVMIGISVLMVLTSCVTQEKKIAVPSGATSVNPNIAATSSPSVSVVKLGFNIAGWT